MKAKGKEGLEQGEGGGMVGGRNSCPGWDKLKATDGLLISHLLIL